MDNALIDQGLSLMLYGMGVVFTFLILLIYATAGMSAVIQRWFPEKEVPVAPKKKSLRKDTGVSPLTLKIIQAAVDQHRQRPL